ncbi:hypothetical protein HOG48_03160 [Candidatus Peregrinibacteria bacterium]|jgi:hypothetical protein|nr:hypothetical protein [Candidatus Peregrinibacteria bacterium]
MAKDSKSMKSFLKWYVPVLIIFLLSTWYILSLGNIWYKLGVLNFFSEANAVAISTFDEDQEFPAWIILEGKPGDVLPARAHLKNYTSDDAWVDVYFSETIRNFPRGYQAEDFHFKDREIGMSDVGLWTEVEEDNVLLTAYENKVVDFSISIPEDAEYGDYSGGIMIESDANSLGSRRSEGGATVAVKARYGLRVYLRVTDIPEERELVMGEEGIENNNALVRQQGMIVGFNFLLLVVLFFLGYPFKKKSKK